MDLYSVGQKAFAFSLLTAVVSTVIALALVSAGVPPETFNVPVFIGMKVFYDMTYSIYNSIPKGEPIDSWTFVRIMATVLAGVFVQFLTSLAGASLLLIQSVAQVLPMQVSFLITPLYFVGAFIQVSSFVYMASKVKEVLSSLGYWK